MPPTGADLLRARIMHLLNEHRSFPEKCANDQGTHVEYQSTDGATYLITVTRKAE